MRLALIGFAIVGAATAVVAADTKFTSTWKAPAGAPVTFAGKKVVALVISDDDSLRVSSEEALASELNARGLVGTPAYRVIPREEIRNPESARAWFDRASAEGVVAMRLVDAKTVRTYTPDTWTTTPYGTLWGYYGYGWSSMYVPGRVDTDTVVSIETLIFSVPRNQLLWAGVSESRNPKDARRLIADLVKTIAKELQKQGLTRAVK
jgi:hypothetical protein